MLLDNLREIPSLLPTYLKAHLSAIQSPHNNPFPYPTFRRPLSLRLFQSFISFQPNSLFAGFNTKQTRGTH